MLFLWTPNCPMCHETDLLPRSGSRFSSVLCMLLLASHHLQDPHVSGLRYQLALQFPQALPACLGPAGISAQPPPDAYSPASHASITGVSTAHWGL